MSLPLLKALSFLIGLSLGSKSFATEKKEEAKEASKEAAKEEAKPEKKDEYGEMVAKVSALQAKVAASKEIIEKLLEEKKHATKPEQISEIVKNLVTEHKTMEKNAEDYEQARSYLQYRFPEKGLKGERVYERIEVKSIDDMEDELNLDSKLKRTMKIVRKQYAKPDEPAKKSSASAEKKKKSAPLPGSDERPTIAEPVILTK